MLQEGEIQPVGSGRIEKVDVRVEVNTVHRRRGAGRGVVRGDGCQLHPGLGDTQDSPWRLIGDSREAVVAPKLGFVLPFWNVATAEPPAIASSRDSPRPYLPSTGAPTPTRPWSVGITVSRWRSSRYKPDPRPELDRDGDSHRPCRAGWAGLIVAGACFILPAVLIVTAIAGVYVRYGALPEIAGVMFGIKPLIIAVVVQALWGLGKAAVKTPFLAGVGAAAFAASLIGANELAVLAAAGMVVAVGRGPRAASVVRCRAPLRSRGRRQRADRLLAQDAIPV